MKVLTVDKSKCNGCGACQVICSLMKKNRIQPIESRIRVRRSSDINLQNVSVCQHCAEPICVTACMKGIIKKDPLTGIVSRNTEGCFGCAACNVRCPVGAIVWDDDLDAYVTCDRCGDDPICVKVCPTSALQFEEITDTNANRRQAYAELMYQAKGVR